MKEELSDAALARLASIARPLVAVPEPLPVDQERFRVVGELGRGGMGVVYEAVDRELGRSVALKVLARGAELSPAARERFLREARAAARLVHPHIASVYDASADVITMQKIEGATLADGAPRDPRLLVALVRDAALAIDFAHGEGIVHRDLKPANLMVQAGERPHVFVMDFGLAKELAVESSLSLSGAVVGTPAYMAPEQAASDRGPIGPLTDVYGLGATLYGCLARRAPFEDDDLYGLLRRVVEEEPTPLRQLAPRVDADLARIVAKAMAKEPGARYPSALALASDLDRWLRGEPVEARAPSVLYRLRRFVSRRQGAVVAAAAAVLVSGLVAAPFLLQARARRLAAEEERETVRSVLELSRRVEQALRDAKATLLAGTGYEHGAHRLLQGAIDECRGFLAERDVEHVHFFLGRLLAAQGRNEEALAAFDRSAALFEDTLTLAQERGLVLAALVRDNVPVLGEPAPAELERWRERGRRDLQRALAEPAATTTPERLYAEAQLAWLQGDLERAIGRQREVLEMDRGHLGAHLSLARLYLLTDRDALAMRHSIEATDLLRGAGRAFLATSPLATEHEGRRIDRELVEVGGLRELLADFDLLLQESPSDAHAYGMRAQVQLREALRALERGEREAARQTLELAVRQFGAVLTLAPDHPAALVDRGVARASLVRLGAGAPGASVGSGASGEGGLEAALVDYDRALALRPDWAFVRYNRALLFQERARLALLERRGEAVREALRRAREDAEEALRKAGPEHPWRARLEALAAELL